MNFFTLFDDRYRDKPKKAASRAFLKPWEKDMTPLNKTKSALRWISAIGVGLSLSLGAISPLAAQSPAQQPNQWLQKKLPGGQPPQHDVKLSFTKSAEQLGCKHVKFKIRLMVQGTPGFWTDPNAFHVKEFTDSSQKITDKLPKGLSWVSASIKGDILGATPFAYSTVSNPNDHFMTNGVKFSANKKDGDGDADARSWTITAIFKIKAAEFPVPKIKANQAKLKVTTPFSTVTAKSHNPALPEPADWKDGKTTKFSVDLSDCDTPGDGGGDPVGEPCIKLEKGEVECKGGPVGNLTYKMPVGPELAGTTIELTSLTPGVVVNPAFQVVPPGGGVLEWDLIGATKGMTVHLLTNNVKQVGPADIDGVATCCTEEIIIDIPEDIPCDEEEKEPDLEVEKVALDAVCDKNAGDCTFLIRVKNVGDKKFEGPLALDEWQIPEKANIVAGPNPTWNCSIPFGMDYYLCKHPALTINPGQFKDLKLSFKPGPAWIGDKIKNCAKLNYGEMGVAPFGDLSNDKDCAEICIKGSPDCPDQDDEKKPELEIKKFDDGTQCIGGAKGLGACWLTYSIIIRNFGDGDYTGPLNVSDSFDIKPYTVQFSPVPPWACATVNGKDFDCSHPVTNIPANGQMILKVVAKFNNPNEIEPKEITNCAKLEQAVLGKHKDCATGKLPDNPNADPEGGKKPDLSIDKQCKPGVLGGKVSCRIMVRNNGAGTPTGMIRIYDVARIVGTNAPLTSEDVTPDGPEWACEGEPVPDLVCAIEGKHLTPGTTRYFDAKIRLSGKGRERYRNCATGHYEPKGTDEDRSIIGKKCVEGGVDIRVEKTGPARCIKGEACTFNVTIKNTGSSDFNGQVKIADALGLAGQGMTVAITSITPPLPCASQPTAVPFVCQGTLDLAAGESQTHKISLLFEESEQVDGTLRNCAMVMDPAIGIARAQSANGQNGTNGNSAIVGCHRFTLDDPKGDQCRPPLVMNDNGVCVCPEGTKWNGRRCIGDQSVPPVIPPVDPEPLCKVGKGEMRTIDNRCICRPGYIRKGPKLCVPPSRGCTPGQGEYKNRKGQCVCLRGYRRGTDGICRKLDTCKPGRNEYKDAYGRCVCKPGFTRAQRGYCVKMPPVCKLGPNEFRNSQGECVCKLGYSRNKHGICVKPDVCKPGRNEYRDELGRCVCKPGFTRSKNGYCVKMPQICKLGPNEYRNSQGQCVCKSGFSRNKYGICQKVPQGCKPGRNEYKDKYGNCVCKSGYTRNNKGVCTKTTTPVPPCRSGKLVKVGKTYRCVCPKGWTRQPIGKKGGAACIKPEVSTPTPDCINGTLKKRGNGWYCSCPKGYNRKAYSNGGAYCSKPPVSAPKPPCYGGKLSKRGKGWYCGCPKGYTRKPIGKAGGASCVKKQVLQPKPPCYNGRLLKRGKGWYCSCPKGWTRKPIGKGGASCQKKAVIYKPKKPINKKPVIKKPIKINPKFQPKPKVFKPQPKVFKPQPKIQLKKKPNSQFF